MPPPVKKPTGLYEWKGEGKDISAICINVDEQKGFGLKAVRSMLQPLGGRMTAHNDGAGSSFVVTVPAAALRKA